MKRKRLFAAVLVLMLGVTLATWAWGTPEARAETEENDCLLFEETFDTLSEEEFAEKYTQLGDANSGFASLASGGVTDGGKALAIDKWAAVETEAPLSDAEELTITAWVRASSSENRLFTVWHDTLGLYHLKGGAIANNDHSVLAWCNLDGAAVATNNPQYDGIYEKNGEGYYSIVVTVTRECIKFYKNALLIDAYYTCNDRATGDVQKFITAFYEALGKNRIIFGGGAFQQEFLLPYYLDEIRIYNYAAKSYNDLCELISVNKNNLSPQYAAIANSASVPALTEEKAPVLFYDFSDVTDGTVANGGTAEDADATLRGEWEIEDGELRLDGKGYMELPAYPLKTSEGDFTVSMEIRRAAAYNQDAFYWFTPSESGKVPSGMNFADCWFKTKSDDPVPRDISWIITDYCDETGNLPHWNCAFTTPDLNEFTLTNVYKDGVLRVYVNGHMVSEQTISGGIAPDTFAQGYIGLGFWDRADFRGNIDNIALYDYAVQTGTLTSIANRLNAYVDLDEDAGADGNPEERFYYDYERFTEHGQNPSELLGEVQIDFDARRSQVFKVREGVTVTVYFRDIENVEKDAEFSVFDALPDELDVPYTDGSHGKLQVRWEQKYEFGTLDTYTGKATDAVGRQSDITYRVTYLGSKDDLARVLAEIEYVLDFEPLYPSSAFAAYSQAVGEAYAQAKETYENDDASAADVLAALAALASAADGAAVPERNTSVQMFALTVQVGASVAIAGEHTDTVSVRSDGLRLAAYDSASGAMNFADEKSLDGTFYLRIARSTAAGRKTAVISAFLIRGGEVVAKIENAVSENYGAVTVRNSSLTDLSLLSFYTGINRRDYTLASLDAFDASIEARSVGTSVADWLMLTQDEAMEASVFAKEAYEKLAYTKIASAAELTEIRCKVGTDISSLIPSTVIVTYDNETKASLKITWDMSESSTNAVGEHTLVGSVAEKDGGKYEITLKITVEGEAEPSTDADGGCGGCGGAANGNYVASQAICLLLLCALLALASRRVKTQKNNKQ